MLAGFQRHITFCGVHCQKPEEAILFPDISATVEVVYNNNSITSKVPARYNTELF
jgi:hypothetical protein